MFSNILLTHGDLEEEGNFKVLGHIAINKQRLSEVFLIPMTRNKKVSSNVALKIISSALKVLKKLLLQRYEDLVFSQMGF